MSKIIRYASISWNSKQWRKRIRFLDPDNNTFRTSSEESEENIGNEILDSHAMFALSALENPSTITLSPTEKETDTYPLKIRSGGMIVIGNGFVYFNDSIEQK